MDSIYHMISSDMCYWIHKKPGTVISETTVQNVTRDDMLDDETAAQVENFNTDINERLDKKKSDPTQRGQIQLRI